MTMSLPNSEIWCWMSNVTASVYSRERNWLVVGFGRGTEEVEVPSVIGLTLQDARSLLLRNRLTVGAVIYDEPEEQGVIQYIYRQTPNAGERLIEGETVALRLSKDIEKAASGGDTHTEEDTWF